MSDDAGQPGPDNAPRGTNLRGRCPVCGATRNLRTRSAHRGHQLPGAVLAVHRDVRVSAYRRCDGSGRPPTTVVDR